MQTFVLVMRVFSYLFILTFFSLSLFTYIFHGELSFELSMEYSVEIAGCFLMLFTTHYMLYVLKKKRNWQNYLFFCLSILYTVYTWCSLILKVVKNS